MRRSATCRSCRSTAEAWQDEDVGGDIGQTVTLRSDVRARHDLGYSLLDQWGYGPDYGSNYGSNWGAGHERSDIRQSGMPGWGQRHERAGSRTVGIHTRFDPTYTSPQHDESCPGKHSLRFGAAIDYQAMNHWQPEFGGTARAAGSTLSGNLSGLRGQLAGAEFLQPVRVVLLG